MKNLLKKTLEKIDSNDFEIEVFGLGYVGIPLAIKLAMAGNKVRGIDNNSERIKNLEKNQLMDSEANLKSNFIECRRKGNLSFSEKSIATSLPKIGFICVPTPIPDEKIQSNVYVKSAIENFLQSSKKNDVIIIESSIEVGTTEEMQKLVESRGFKVGEDFGLCFCPERIDPLNKNWNLENIPRVIYCSDDISFNIAQKIYQHVNNSNLVRVHSPKIAEVVKSFENAFRLVNISLVNELAILCDKLKINVNEVIKTASTKTFGFMPFYSGAGAGGHCIPKDPIFLLNSSKKFGYDFKTINDSLQINSFVPKYISNSLENLFNEFGLEKKIILCGMSYKPDIEDMRDSPGFKILNELIKRKFQVSVYDPFFKEAHLEKYLLENHLENVKFEIIKNLDDNSIRKFSGMCIIQHHTNMKPKIQEIYKRSLVPLIYDCQSKMEKDTNSKTILKFFGSD